MSKLQFLFLFILVAIFHLSSQAQNKTPYQLSVAVLLPDEVTVDNKTQILFDSLYTLFKEKQNPLNEIDLNKLSPNIQIIEKKKREIFPFFKISDGISLQTAQEFSNGFEKGSDSFLIYPINQKTTTDLIELKKIAHQEAVNYIIGFSQVSYSKIKDDFKINASTFLYDVQKDEILFQKHYDSNPPEQKYAQSNFGKFDYKQTGLIYQFGQEMFTWIIQNSPQYKDPEKVWQARRDFIIKNLYPQEPNPEILEILFAKKQEVLEKSNNFDLKVDFRAYLKKDTTEYFQGFFNADKTQFIAFLSNKREVQEGSFAFGNVADTIPRPSVKKEKWKIETVLGLLYESKWYIRFTNFDKSAMGTDVIGGDLEAFKKEYLTNLIQMDYFKPHSAELNPDFWERGEIQTDFSEEIASEKESLKFKNKFESEYLQQKRVNRIIKEYERQAKENAPYKGLPRIVAEAMQREKPEYWENIYFGSARYVDYWVFDDFAQDFKKSKYKPFANIEQLIKTYENESVQPNEKPYCLAPFIAIDKKGNQTLRFFLFHKEEQKIYDWIYFKPFLLEKKYTEKGSYFEHKEYMEELIDKKMIEWFGSIESEDISKETFWQENVFKKKKGKYEFLRYVAHFPKGE